MWIRADLPSSKASPEKPSSRLSKAFANPRLRPASPIPNLLMQVFAICAERLRPTASSAIPSSREWDERVEAPNNGLFILIALWSAAACRRFLTSTVSASGLSFFPKISLYSANQHLANYEYGQSERYFKNLVHSGSSTTHRP